MGDFTKFKTVIQDLVDLFNDLAEVEHKKLRAISDNNLKALEDSMKEEQAGIMRLRGLEKRREESQRDLGLSGLSFKEIIEKLDGEKVLAMGELYTSLEEALSIFNKNADSAKTAIETNLYSIDAVLAQLQNGKNDADKTGLGEKAKGFTSKKV